MIERPIMVANKVREDLRNIQDLRNIIIIHFGGHSFEISVVRIEATGTYKVLSFARKDIGGNQIT